jgi:predicted nucleic acid-binding protein
MTRVALDSNILVYLDGDSRTPADDPKVERVRKLVARLSSLVSLVAPAQTLGELFVVLRRSGASATEAREILLEFPEAFGTAATEARTMATATDLTVDHKLQFWDAVVVTAAYPSGGCRLAQA